MSEDVKFGVTAQDEGFAAQMAAMQAQAKEAAEQIKASFEGVTKTFEKIQSAFVAFTAALAGGEAFKEMIAGTVNASVEAVKMGRALGISATEASELKVGLDSVYVSQEDFGAASGKITVALKKNESAFTDLGVATRDSSGNLRNALDIQLDTNAALLTFSEGTDRNVEGVKIYGRSWATVQDTLKLTPAVMEEARAKAASLGLVVGQENVAAANRFRAAQNNMHEVLEAVEKVISEAVMPILSDLGEWFGEHGPAVVNVFRAAIYSIQVAFIEFKGVIVNWVDSIAGSMDIAMAYVRRFQQVAIAALTLNPGKIKDAWEKGTQDIVNTQKVAYQIIEDDAKTTAAAVAKALEDNAGNSTPTKKPQGGEKSDGGDDKLKSQMAALEAELEAEKANFAARNAAKGIFIEYSVAQEEAYWLKIKAAGGLNQADGISVDKKISTDRVTIAKQGFDSEISAMKAQESQYKNNLQAKLDIAIQMAAKIKTATVGGDQKEANEAAAAVLDIQREMNAKKLEDDIKAEQAHAASLLRGVAAELAAATQSEAIGNMSKKQLLDQEKIFEAQKFAIQAESQTRLRALLADAPDANPEKVAQVQAQIEALADQHAAAMNAISAKSAQYQKQQYQQLFNSINSGFASSLASLFKGTATISQTLHSMIASVGTAMAQMAAKNIANMILAATISKLMASQEKKDNASAAFGSAYASAAKIPYVGWILGPVAGAAAYAAVMSAKGGYDIPAGVNPVTQLHENEMVLPERQADVIRNLADGEGGGNGGPDFHMHVHAMDSTDVAKFFKKNGKNIAESFQGHLRSTGRLAPGH